MRARVLGTLLLIAGALGPGTALATPAREAPAHRFAATTPPLTAGEGRFVADMGVAYGVFRHWALLPYQHNYFAPGQPGRAARLSVAGAALRRCEPSLLAALSQAETDPRLRPLLPLVGAMASGFDALGATWQSGTLSAIGMRGTAGLTQVTEALQAKLGLPVTETDPVPGAAF